MMKAGHTPRLIMHDIDANKPGGSIVIRTKTFAYSLELESEKLEQQRIRFEQLKSKLQERMRKMRTTAAVVQHPSGHRRLHVIPQQEMSA